MKKKLLLLIAALFSLATVSTVSADNPIKDKTLRKAYKKTVKTLKSEGWKVEGDVQTLDAVFESYYAELSDSEGTMQILIGDATSATYNTAKDRAKVHAKKQYSELKGVEIDVTNDTKIENTNSSEGTSTNTRFSSSSVSKSQHKVKNFTPKVCIYRKVHKKDKESFEVRAYYLVATE